MSRGAWLQPRRRPNRSFVEILEERGAASPKDPAEAARSFVYVLARELIRREAGGNRAEQVVRDFEEAATALVRAASDGATVGEQEEILQEYWQRFELPEPDLRKRREPRGPTDAQLLKEYEALHSEVKPILRHRKNKARRSPVQELRKLAPWATQRALRDAAQSAPAAASCMLIGSRYHLGASTVRNRISTARKQT